MGRGAVIADGLEALWRFFRGKPDFVIPERVPAPTLPRVDPSPPPLRPPTGPRVPRIPPTTEPETETSPLPETAPDTAPETQTERDTTTTTEEMQECEDCPECEPHKQGHAIFRTLTGTEASKLSGAQYQNWVIPWFRWEGNKIEEWKFSGIDFDGIDQTACLLVETKGRYGFMFYPPNGLFPSIAPWGEDEEKKMTERQFPSQYYAVFPYQDHASLLWVIHNWSLWIYMGAFVSDYGSFANVEHRPFPGWHVDD